MNTKVDLSIVVVSYNTKKLTRQCIETVLNTISGIKYEIIIIDNASSDGSTSVLLDLSKNTKKVGIILNKNNVGFGAANNQGIMESKGRYVLLLNSDTIMSSEILPQMIEWMDMNPEIGISTCSLLNEDGSLQGTGGYFPTLPRVFSWMIVQDLPFVDRFIKPFHPMKEKSIIKGKQFYRSQKELDWVTGAFFLINRNVFTDVPGFDEDYFMYTEEVDFCYRAKQCGWKVVYHPRWSIIHLGGASGTKESAVLREFDGVKLFYKKHYSRLHMILLRLLLKIGSLIRMIVFRITDGKDVARIYSKALKEI